MKRHAVILFLLVLLAGSLSMANASTFTVVDSWSWPGNDPASNTGSIVAPGVTDNFGIEIIAEENSSAPSSEYQCVFYNGNTSNAGWGIYATGTMWAGLFGGVTEFFGGTETPNTPTALALVDDNGVTTLYVNGNAVNIYGGGPNAPAGNLLFGENNIGTENFNGNLSNAEIFTFTGTFTPSELESVPEPSSLALAFVGLGGIALASGVRRRRATR